MSSDVALNILDPSSIVSSVGLLGLMVVIFAETGLFVGFFLPGDSLLFLAGAFCAGDAAAAGPHLHLPTVLLGACAAAVAGAQTGYLIGRRAGPRLFDRPNSRLFRQEYVEQARGVLDRYGFGKAVVLARFVPVVRTFLNPLAGVVRMPARVFTTFNLIGGLLWAAGVTLLGYALGRTIPIEHYMIPVSLAIVLLSAIPVLREYLAHRRARTGRAPGEAASSSPER
ncbi:DedA family protein [Candidatus Frankia alpina]|uniref:DedA family protein n=1 Tax=Candidatus Frankia alpina TaxID=2699483 RepID=A0A4S5CLY7_9ACTN|nr:DedA family protein [Candidatus Frankia alpina]THJ46839.1 DedA family protein [Candidatus Frankia alpina]